MKVLYASILLLITLIGSFFPCCASDSCPGDAGHASTSAGQHQQMGTCSPFFACSTCSGAVVVHAPVQISAPVTAVLVHTTPLYLIAPQTYTASFFQPPRLVKLRSV